MRTKTRYLSIIVNYTIYAAKKEKTTNGFRGIIHRQKKNPVWLCCIDKVWETLNAVKRPHGERTKDRRREPGHAMADAISTCHFARGGGVAGHAGVFLMYPTRRSITRSLRGTYGPYVAAAGTTPSSEESKQHGRLLRRNGIRLQRPTKLKDHQLNYVAVYHTRLFLSTIFSKYSKKRL